MDIEEGEIIISDVSSDDSNFPQSQPWNKDKFQDTFESFRFHNNQHKCNENSFCRKTFSWSNCLASDTIGKRSRTKPRSEKFFSYSTSRTQNKERNHGRPKYGEHLDHRINHETQRSKNRKRKRKGRIGTPLSTRHKPERTLHQLISHSSLINEMTQQLRTPPSATVTHENPSLMQKLITSGLAKPPFRSEAPTEVGVVLSSSESETCIKKEKTPVIDIESRDYSDDSEIEVIIPPKKVPPLVTLDSDGEEVEQRENESINNSQPSQTLDHGQTLSDAATSTELVNSSSPKQNQTSNEGKSEDLSLNNNELLAENLSHNNASEPDDNSSDSLDSEMVSELCDVLAYSPSSPSSCNSGDVNLIKDSDSQSLVSSRHSRSQNVQFKENLYNNSSTLSNEEVSSEIWLEVNDQLTSENLDETNMLTSVRNVPSKENLGEECVSSTNIDLEKPSFEKENSLSDLVENFIMKSVSSNSNSYNDNISPKKLESNKEQIVQLFCGEIDRNESAYSSERKHQKLKNSEDVSSLPFIEMVNVSDEELETIVDQDSQSLGKSTERCKKVDKHLNNVPTSDSNESHFSVHQKMLSEDEEPYSPCSTYDCDKTKKVSCDFKSSSNSNDLDFTLSTQLSFLETPSAPINGHSKESMVVDCNHTVLETLSNNKEVGLKSTNYGTTIHQDYELKTNLDSSEQLFIEDRTDKSNEIISKGQNSKTSTKECEVLGINRNIEPSDDDEDNVSQLRMLALLTKGKATSKEILSAKCNKNNKAELASKYSDQNLAELTTSKATNSVDEDDDELQLRVAALKSAVMKKYGERKKRGLLVKKRKRAASGFGDDIFNSADSNLASEQVSSCPLSPTKSSASVQGEEDMELADSDVGEDVIEEVNASIVEEESKQSEAVCWTPSNVLDSSVRTYEIPSKMHILSRNESLIAPHQPLPPGVDGECPESTNQAIFTSVLPPPPPPPPPLVFTPNLPPPPPPPPLPPTCIESSQPHQSPLFHNNSTSKHGLNNPKLCPQEQSATTNNPAFPDLCHQKEDLKINNSVDFQPHFNDHLEDKRPKKLITAKCQVRSNLIAVPVEEKMSKPVLTKNKLRKRRRVRGNNKSIKVPNEPETNLLCITKPPGKSSIKLGGNINVATVQQPNIKSGYGLNCEGNQETSSSCKGITSVVLCKTNPHLNSCEDVDNMREHEGFSSWHEQIPLACITNSAESNLSEEKSVVGDEIDLSEMIVLDEVGMSPEHKPKSECNWDYNSPQEDDEDENTLRIQALTTLSPKSVSKRPNSASEPSYFQTHFQADTYKNWENYDPGRNDYNSGRGLVSPRVKPREVRNQRKVVGVDNTKYRLTRTMSNDQRRSVVHGRESLKVVIPTNSPPLEPPIPLVKRLVINVEKDSDSEEECEWTRKIRIQDTNTFHPPGPVVDEELERSIDELLLRARNSVDKHSTLKQNHGGNAKKHMQKSENKKISDNDFSLHDTPLKLLPKEKQEEYKRLRAILERKEKERQQMKTITTKKIVPEKSKPLLQHVLINENNKQNQLGDILPKGIKNNVVKKKRDLSMTYGVGKSGDSAEVKIHSDKDSYLSFTAQGKCNRQKNYNSDSNAKVNCLRKVVFNETTKLNVSNVQKSSGFSPLELKGNENLQYKEVKSSGQYQTEVGISRVDNKEQLNLVQKHRPLELVQKDTDQNTDHGSVDQPEPEEQKNSAEKSVLLQQNNSNELVDKEAFEIYLLENKQEEYETFNSFAEVNTETVTARNVTLQYNEIKSLSGQYQTEVGISRVDNKEQLNVQKHGQLEFVQKDMDQNTEHGFVDQPEPEEQKNSAEKSVILQQSNSNELVDKEAFEIYLLELENKQEEYETFNSFAEVNTKTVTAKNVTIKNIVQDKDNKSCCEVSSDNKSRNENFNKSKMDTTDVGNARCVISEEKKKEALENVRSQIEASPASERNELEQGNGRLCRIDTEKSYSNKDNCMETFKRRMKWKWSDVSNDLDPTKDSHQNVALAPEVFPDNVALEVCHETVEVLATKKSELLNERFGLLDDLSEMADSLDDLDSQQGRLEQAVIEISDLRRALCAAENTLCKQIMVAQGLEHRLLQTHTAVSARYTNIGHLERTLQRSSHDIPTTAQKLMSKKVKQVKDKIDKVKGKRSIIKRLLNNPHTTKEELTEMHSTFLMRKNENSEPDDVDITTSLWLQDPNISQLEALPIKNITLNNNDHKTDSETQTLLWDEAEVTDEAMDHKDIEQPKPCKEAQQLHVQSSDSHKNSSELAIEQQFSREEEPCEFATGTSTTNSEFGTDVLSCVVSNSSHTPVQFLQTHGTSSIVGSENISSTFKNLNRQAKENNAKSSDFLKGERNKEPYALKRSITKVSGISESVVAKKPNFSESKNSSCKIDQTLIRNTRHLKTSENCCQGKSDKKQNVSIKAGTSKSSKSLFQYKSILHHGNSSRVDNSAIGQAILCPYDLTGRCQDKQCKFQHFQ